MRDGRRKLLSLALPVPLNTHLPVGRHLTPFDVCGCIHTFTYLKKNRDENKPRGKALSKSLGRVVEGGRKETKLRREEDKHREEAQEDAGGRQSRDVGTLRGGGTGWGALREPEILCSQSSVPGTLY